MRAQLEARQSAHARGRSEPQKRVLQTRFESKRVLSHEAVPGDNQYRSSALFSYEFMLLLQPASVANQALRKWSGWSAARKHLFPLPPRTPAA